MIKILALDQARNGGWAVFDYESKKLAAFGFWSFPTNRYSYAQAIVQIESFVENLIKAYDISAVFIEDIQVRVNIQSFKKLAQLQGVLVNLFEKANISYEYVAPARWQSYCGAEILKEKAEKSENTEVYGKKRSKIMSVRFVKEKYNIETDNDNLADACCIGTWAVNQCEARTDDEGKVLIIKADKSANKSKRKKNKG